MKEQHTLTIEAAPPGSVDDAGRHDHPGAHTSSPVHQAKRKPTGGLGYFAVFVVAVALLTANNSLLRAMTKDLVAEQRAAEEAKKPAEVEAVVLQSPDCTSCYNVAGLISNLGANKKVKLTSTRTVDAASSDGVSLAKQYALARSPALIIRGEAQKLLATIPGLKNFGQLQGDIFVGSLMPAPYVELATGKVRGAFDATYITEKQCKECYDPTINREALQQLGMKPAAEKTVDRADAEGQRLVKEYKLTSSPTMVLAGDLAAYPGFDKLWKENVGTIEPDGAYVFRTAQERMGTYYNLTTKKVVVPPQPTSNTNSSAP